MITYIAEWSPLWEVWRGYRQIDGKVDRVLSWSSSSPAQALQGIKGLVDWRLP